MAGSLWEVALAMQRGEAWLDRVLRAVCAVCAVDGRRHIQHIRSAQYAAANVIPYSFEPYLKLVQYSWMNSACTSSLVQYKMVWARSAFLLRTLVSSLILLCWLSTRNGHRSQEKPR